MSLATASMTDNAAPPTNTTWQSARAWPTAPALPQLKMAMPLTNAAPTSALSAMEKLPLAGSFGKIPLQQSLAGGLCAQQCAQAAWPQGPWPQAAWPQAAWPQAAAWPGACAQQCSAHQTGAPAVDMLVLPSGNSCAVTHSKDDTVEVSYTSAEQLADALFPTDSASTADVRAQLAQHSTHLEDLSDHRELVHSALLDHRDQVNELNEKTGMLDEGLLDHRKHITQLRSQSADMLKRMNAQENALSKLQKDMQSLNTSSKSMHTVLGAHADGIAALKEQHKQLTAQNKELDKGLRSHTACLDLQNNSLKSLSTRHDTLASTQLQVKDQIASLSKTLNKSPEVDHRQQQIQQLQKTMLETQAQLARLHAQQQPTNTVEILNGPRVRR